jgi:cytochrome c oxidase accessory protein FixG
VNQSQQNPQSYTPQSLLPTMDQTGKRRWLYPDRRDGRYASRRRLTALGLIAFYLVMPWLTFGGIPLLRVDVFEGQAYFFGQVLHVNESNLLALVLAGLALFLLLATLVKGRIWCSYGCPQTVFVDWVIRPIEELIEGNAHRRRKVDSGPLHPQDQFKKVLKHVLFLVVAAIVSNTFVAYFVGPERLRHWMLQPPSDHPVPFFVMTFIMLGFYADLAWFREQFCSYLCPYARFQSVMIDADTPTVTYNAKRGEKRGRSQSKEDQRGDCIDCGLCVRVCPTGIDIRNGLQPECVMCARCIDACHMIMTNLDRPTGLIKVMTQNEYLGQTVVPMWKRPRVIAYASAVAFLFGMFLLKTVGRHAVSINVIRSPGAPYTQMPNDRYGNVFIFQVNNNTGRDIALQINPQTEGVELLCGQCTTTIPAHNELRISAIVSFPRQSKLQSAQFSEGSSGIVFNAPILSP